MAPLDKPVPAARPARERTPEELAEIAALKALTPEEIEAGIAYWQAFFDSLPLDVQRSFDEVWGQDASR